MKRNVPKCLAVLLGVLCLWGGATLAGADPVRPAVRHPGMTPNQRREIVKQLNLTDSQRLAVQQRRASFRKRMQELKNDIALKSVERDTELEKKAPDQAKVHRLTDEIGALKNQRSQENNNHQAEFEKLLTPAQLEKWRTILKDRKSAVADVDAAAD